MKEERASGRSVIINDQGEKLENEEGTDEDESKSISYIDFMETKISSMYYRLGFFCAMYPKLIIFATIMLTVLCSLGISQMRTEDDPAILWTPKHSTSVRDRDIIDDSFPDQLFVQSSFILDVSEGVPIRDGILQVLDTLEIGENVEAYTQIDGEEELVQIRDVCIKVFFYQDYQTCHSNSVLNFFFDEDFVTNPPSFFGTIRAKINALSDQEIEDVLVSSSER